MNTFISEFKRLKFANGNHINSIEKKLERKKAIKNQLDLLYGNPIKFENKINYLESQLITIEV